MDNNEQIICGGWSFPKHVKRCELPKEVGEAFDIAMKEYVGAGFTPVYYMGSQVVAGLNYALICHATYTTNPIKVGFCRVIINQPLPNSGNKPSVVRVDNLMEIE